MPPARPAANCWATGRAGSGSWARTSSSGLAGLAPPSLFARAMQVLVTAISPGRFPEALDELPLPPFLQPLDLTGKG
ncbi:Ankyrin repeat domain-containing protein 9 [Camelus dromedarius]|uniref:Ankyrin repeat domain-containing protein 9 n=1 Tax=Camelus dromedarius TaxID=9838 RepID=A0A5N4E4G6_CAMDR|nr:Ankyrin repeat domain-containing protein 9 [Camelus dromedarius]